VPMNHFHARLSSLQFDLETAATNALLLAAQHGFDKEEGRA
jgi:hypothetical protein